MKKIFLILISLIFISSANAEDLSKENTNKNMRLI